jgi:hypothetical protein
MFTALFVWLQAGLARLRDDRGLSETTALLLWIIGAIAIVGIVMGVLNGYIADQLSKIH